LGIINSRFIGWFFRKKYQISSEDTFPQIMLADILNLPIPSPDKAHHDRMVGLVEKMLELHKRLAAAKGESGKPAIERLIAATDSEIDRLVYDLYGLTAEEINIVEGHA
jgi:hypothetical protein